MSKCCKGKQEEHKVDVSQPSRDKGPYAEKTILKPRTVDYVRPSTVTQANDGITNDLSEEDKDAMHIINKFKRKRDQEIIAMYETSDSLLAVAQICVKYGYPFERFHYETEDGYLL